MSFQVTAAGSCPALLAGGLDYAPGKAPSTPGILGPSGYLHASRARPIGRVKADLCTFAKRKPEPIPKRGEARAGKRICEVLLDWASMSNACLFEKHIDPLRLCIHGVHH